MSRQASAVSRFVHKYRGVEGFYFLNRSGELGYIKSNELRSIKETFPQLNNKQFLKIHPRFMTELECFLRDVGQLTTAYGNEEWDSLELGYVLPANENQPWRSATLVLHKQVLDTLRSDEDLLYRKGIKDPFQADTESEKFKGIRSIQHGLDDLVNHRDVFGNYKYFPVLFYLPEHPLPPKLSQHCARLRVVNLKWRKPADATRSTETTPAPPNVADLNGQEEVFNVLRENLTLHGAIDRSKRVENRLSVV